MMGQSKTFYADVFLKDKQELDIAGDSLFCGSIGRTDFKGGSMSDLVRTVKEKIMTLPEHTEVYPGHNDTTTIENERMYNPYL